MEKIRTDLPLDMDALRAVITTPDVVVEIDYANSKLKGTAALIYLTNVSIPAVFFDMTDASTADCTNLVDSYIIHKSTVFVPQLVDSIMHLLLVRKGVAHIPHELTHNSILSTLDIQHWCEDDQKEQHLQKLMAVLDNLPLFAVTCAVGFKETYGDPKLAFATINDVNYCGFTFVHLLKHPLILDYFAQGTELQPTYFIQQFDEYIYGGKSLFTFVAQSPVLAIMDCIVNGSITVDKLVGASNEISQLEFEEGVPA
jgi:hypothetical protein